MRGGSVEVAERHSEDAVYHKMHEVYEGVWISVDRLDLNLIRIWRSDCLDVSL